MKIAYFTSKPLAEAEGSGWTVDDLDSLSNRPQTIYNFTAQ